MYVHPLVNPVTGSWFPRSTSMDEWNDMLSWCEYKAQQQRLLEQSLQFQHTSQKNCNTQCADNCMKKPIQRTYHRPSLPKHSDCTNACGSDTVTVPNRASHNIGLEWSGMEPSSKQYIITAHIPDGFQPNEVNISLNELDRSLSITCQQTYHHQQKDFVHATTTYTQRTIHIPDDVQLQTISASKDQGEANRPHTGSSLTVLIHMPKLNCNDLAPKASIKPIPIQ